MIVTLKAKELGDLVRFLKRAKLIGTDYLIKNDMWIPRTRTPESRPGTHILRGYHPIVQDKVFLVKDIRTAIDALENVTGKKGMITISADYNGISITLRDGAITIPIAFPTEEKFPIDANDFEHYLSAFDGNWESLSGDISFDNNLQRCIAVDIRYILFIVEKLGGCKNLIDEMTIVE